MPKKLFDVTSPFEYEGVKIRNTIDWHNYIHNRQTFIELGKELIALADVIAKKHQRLYPGIDASIGMVAIAHAMVKFPKDLRVHEGEFMNYVAVCIQRAYIWAIRKKEKRKDINLTEEKNIEEYQLEEQLSAEDLYIAHEDEVHMKNSIQAAIRELMPMIHASKTRDAFQRRKWLVYNFILEEEAPSVAEVAEQFEVSDTQIRNDLEFIFTALRKIIEKEENRNE